jgi:hypothetical protein
MLLGQVGAALASSAAALVWAAEHAVALAVHGPNARRLAFTTTTTTTTKRRNSKHEAASGSQGVKEGQQEQDEADPAAAAAAATGKQSASQGPGARRHKTLKAHQLAFGTTVKQVGESAEAPVVWIHPQCVAPHSHWRHCFVHN